MRTGWKREEKRADLHAIAGGNGNIDDCSDLATALVAAAAAPARGDDAGDGSLDAADVMDEVPHCTHESTSDEPSCLFDDVERFDDVGDEQGRHDPVARVEPDVVVVAGGGGGEEEG